MQQGVIFDPVRNDLFTATRGRGAFLNDRRIRVSKRQHLRDCLIGTGFPFRDGSYLDTYLQMMKAMITQTAGLRRPGAAALDLAYVAAGFYDGFWEVGLNPWDVAAGSLLVLEAGGLIGDLAGEGNYLLWRAGHRRQPQDLRPDGHHAGALPPGHGARPRRGDRRRKRLITQGSFRRAKRFRPSHFTARRRILLSLERRFRRLLASDLLVLSVPAFRRLPPWEP